MMNVLRNYKQALVRYVVGNLLYPISKYWNGLFRREENNNSASVGSFYDNNSFWKTLGQIGLLQLLFYLSMVSW